MNFIFQSINFETIVPYMERWRETKQKSSDYSSGVLLCWERAFGYQFAFDDDEGLVWIKGTKPHEHFLAPVGKWNIKGWDEVLAARFGPRSVFHAVPEKLVAIWKKQMGDAVIAEEDRASFEYIHKAADLAELPGRRYIKKRNRINQFCKLYPHEYLPLTPALVPRVIDFQRAWCESYRVFGSASIESESEGVIRAVLSCWEDLPQLVGGVIEVMGRIAAYTIAEKVDDTLMIHFEKASLDYNAAYQVINQEFIRREGEGFKYVNREEDMGDPGLRDAKMSYHPCGFIKKYTVTIDLD